MRLERAPAFAAIALLSAVRIASTWRVFSQTVDEPIHIAAGLQWLTNGGLDLDWGQDLLRLAAAVRTLHIQHLYIDYFGSADPRRLLPCSVEELPRDAPVRGWVAVSKTALVMGNIEWLKSHRPVREVGKSIRVYELH